MDTTLNTELSPQLDIPPLISKILQSRGIHTNEQALQLFSPSLKELSHPSCLLNLNVAVDRLIQARQAGEKVAVYGDFDLDGTSGAALLVEGLEMLGLNRPIFYQPDRIAEGYGFHAHAVEYLQGLGVSLIITVDVGITAIEACEKARELKVDVIITDHHQPKETLPEALAVVNPNQKDCKSQLGHLSGTGVGYYLLLGLSLELKNQNLLSKPVDLKSLLDFFCIGTITDMVPLIKENRVLVKHGFKVLAKTQRPGLKELLSELKLYKKELSTADVAIRFAPKLNALSRLSSGLRPIDLYLENDQLEASRLVQETLKINQQRVGLQKSGTQLAMDLVKANGKPPFSFLWVASEKFHKGVIGLIATQLANKYSCPAYVGSIDGGKISGSARSSGEEGAASVLEGLNSASLALNQFGGHPAAAGFELVIENQDSFRDLLTNHFKDIPSETTLSNDLNYDVEANFSEIHASFMSWYSELEPFGVEFETPRILVRNVKVHSIRLLKETHLKLSLSQDRPEHRLDGIWFSVPKNKQSVMSLLDGAQSADVIFEVQWNEFAGKRSIQLLIQDIPRAS